MRFLLILSFALLILAATASRTQAADPYQWVSYTTQTFDGAGNGYGFDGMTTQCRAECRPADPPTRPLRHQ